MRGNRDLAVTQARGHHTTPQLLEGSGVSLGSLLVGWFGGRGPACKVRKAHYARKIFCFKRKQENFSSSSFEVATQTLSPLPPPCLIRVPTPNPPNPLRAPGAARVLLVLAAARH